MQKVTKVTQIKHNTYPRIPPEENTNGIRKVFASKVRSHLNLTLSCVTGQF